MGVLTLLFALAAGPSACGPSPERLRCLDYCEQQNDTCLLNAATSVAIQTCGMWTSQCVGSCPTR